MKYLFIILFFLLNSTIYSQEKPKEQLKYINTDKTLNKLYKQIIKEFYKDSLFLSKLKISQRNWMKFRDSEIQLLYPELDVKNEMQNGNKYLFRSLTQITNERNVTLKKWILGFTAKEFRKNDYWSPISIPCYHSNDGDTPMTDVYIEEGKIIVPNAMYNPNNEHHFFGYSEENYESEKLILFSSWTKAVENNYRNCKHGAFYWTGKDFEEKGYELYYISHNNKFVKAELVVGGNERTTVYFDKYWFDKLN